MPIDSLFSMYLFSIPFADITLYLEGQTKMMIDPLSLNDFPIILEQKKANISCKVRGPVTPLPSIPTSNDKNKENTPPNSNNTPNITNNNHNQLGLQNIITDENKPTPPSHMDQSPTHITIPGGIPDNTIDQQVPIIQNNEKSERKASISEPEKVLEEEKPNKEHPSADIEQGTTKKKEPSSWRKWRLWTKSHCCSIS